MCKHHLGLEKAQMALDIFEYRSDDWGFVKISREELAKLTPIYPASSSNTYAFVTDKFMVIIYDHGDFVSATCINLPTAE